ncbi:M20 family peptidase [Neptunicella sp. SCSIO 80796]|uniref:M20 family peptidase n=1 Tax=Neptunicella plasticusilytica TaxID=3117012 RepID=UPI003A4E39ED
MKKIIVAILLVIVSLVAILLIRATTFYNDKQYQVKQPLVPVQLDETNAVRRFAEAIQIPTVSYDDPARVDYQRFEQLHAHLQQAFPLVHQQAELTKINDYSLVYYLPGTNPELKPALFMGHMDVVPVDDSTLSQWSQPPFSGLVQDDVIWGRGTIDDKVTVMALMEATEQLLKNDFQPQRSIYLAFGHDEEIGGEQGAKAIAAYFAKQHIQFEFVLDEGGAVTKGLMAGVQPAVAMVGVAEKGFVNFRLTVDAEGGHSSQPPKNTAVGILSQAIVNVENSPFDSKLDFIQQTFDAVGYYTPLSSRLPMANLWLLSPVVENVLLDSPSTAAGIHTTIAPTMLQGSSKSNVLPSQATAVVNFRILPGDSINSIEQHIIRAIDDPRVKVDSFMGNEPSRVSPTDSLGFKLIEQTIRRLDKDILVAPYLVQGGTDSKYYYGLSDNVYRFMMVGLDPISIKQFHGINEQIPVADYLRAIQFYYALLKQTAENQVVSH